MKTIATPNRNIINLTTILLFLVFFTIQQNVSGQSHENVIQNPSLELNLNNWNTDICSINTNFVKEGEKSLSIKKSGSASINSFSVTEMNNYRIAVYMKSLAASGNAGFGIDWMDANGNEIAEYHQPFNVLDNESFKRYEFFEKAPANAIYALIWFYNSSDGEIVIDDLSVVNVTNKEKLNLVE